MRNLTPNYVNNCRWDSVGKIDSRTIGIIQLYREIFEEESIPRKNQYWTMCGAHFNRSGPIRGELGHLTDDKLIVSQQYFGVDREKEIIISNAKIHPNVRWLCGDFLDCMERYKTANKFNPRIINYDGVMQPRHGTMYLRKIMKFIDYNVPSEILLVANFVLVNPYTRNQKYRFTINQTIQMLKKIYIAPKHWTVIPQAYVYPGTNTNNYTEMGMIMFYKDNHDIENIEW